MYLLAVAVVARRNKHSAKMYCNFFSNPVVKNALHLQSDHDAQIVTSGYKLIKMTSFVDVAFLATAQVRTHSNNYISA